MKNKIYILLVSIFVFFGKANAQYCTDNNRYTDVNYFEILHIHRRIDLQYGTSQDFQGKPYPLEMDLYYPDLSFDYSPKRPFVMLFHGGGFSSGDKQEGDITTLCILLTMRGFVTASVNYRLGYDFTEYGQYKARYRAIQDGNAALRFIVNNADLYRIDTNWLFLGGQSAGSLLAFGMVYADQPELDSISLLYNSSAIGVELGDINKSGNNLTNTYTIKGIFNNWGAVAENEVDFDEMIPTISFHGELDSTVLIDADNSSLYSTLLGSRTIHNKLIDNNICSEINIDKSSGHGIYRNSSSLFRAQKASCFFKSIFCNECSDFYSTDSIPSNCSTISSIVENVDDYNISIFPNPFDNTFQIEGVKGLNYLTIYNCFGQIVYEEENNNGTVNIDLPQGIYFLNFRQIQLNKSFTIKLMKN